ncbi:RbtT/DalT/CsbX family MFS transporter [Curtobacterium sp. MCLR17_036]|uniref:RbtT/DalT/CsbX family MFS transporter n=1 Tax=Curtobacterium sp. MCLR17_036 TaxID=2175620 RepID=UPI000DA8C989|nr:RbtT/DalT/CsbX family MFS transporter [Curtobacterium sp. MCLR17_036]WIE65721.1 RbtT/DalT/CsbX family MFS transporter [Curtobacterium sp. MCLR17_036]
MSEPRTTRTSTLTPPNGVTATESGTAAPPSAAAAPARQGLLARLGIPHPLRWGFLGVLVFMTGDGIESNFIAPHIAGTLGSGGSDSAAMVIGLYGVAVLVASYAAGVLSELWGPRRVMTVGAVLWVVFQVAFLAALSTGSVGLIALTYFLRGLGFPLFAFSFLCWVNHTVARERNATAVGWFYVVFTGGLPTLGSLIAIGSIPAFGGGQRGETGSMALSLLFVAAGWAIVRFGVHEPTGLGRIAPRSLSAARVLASGIEVCVKRPKVLLAVLIRLVNTAPEFGMFVIMPTVIGTELGWGQSKWLTMTVIVYAGNILFNAFFGALGDRIGWIRTVKWFGIAASAVGLLAWWYVPHLVPAGSEWGFWLATAAGTVFGIMLAGFTPMGAIVPAFAGEDRRGAAMAMYATAAGGATFLGNAVVSAVLPWGGAAGVVWTFVGLYVVAFVVLSFLKVPERAVAAGH